MQRTIDVIISVLASALAFLLSWPFWRDFEFWPESHLAWWIYFILGFVLSIYVFYIFIESLRMLFTHDADPTTVPGNENTTLAGSDDNQVKRS